MRNIVFHRLAYREVHEAAAWYASRSEHAGQRFRQAVTEAVNRISDNPLAYAEVATPYRAVRTRRFPYVLIYDVLPDGSVLVVAIAHTARRPGYWQRRKRPPTEIVLTLSNVAEWPVYQKLLNDGKIVADKTGRIRYLHGAPVGKLILTRIAKDGTPHYSESAAEWFDPGSKKSQEFIWPD